MPLVGACQPALLSCTLENLRTLQVKAACCPVVFTGVPGFISFGHLGRRRGSGFVSGRGGFLRWSSELRKGAVVLARAELDERDVTSGGKSLTQVSYEREFLKVASYGEQIPTQAEAVTGASGTIQAEFKSLPDLDYLQELLAIQQQGPRAIGFFGTRNMGFMHQQLIEILSYAMVITKNHIYTSGASGTNAAVIRGALRAERPDLLTVILPQSLKMQPPESRELLAKVQNVVEMPHNDHLPLIEASRLCNMDILSNVQQVICFAFHDSNLLMETCREAKNLRKIVTLFYLD